jgi:hypothetical protein
MVLDRVTQSAIENRPEVKEETSSSIALQIVCNVLSIWSRARVRLLFTPALTVCMAAS